MKDGKEKWPHICASSKNVCRLSFCLLLQQQPLFVPKFMLTQLHVGDEVESQWLPFSLSFLEWIQGYFLRINPWLWGITRVVRFCMCTGLHIVHCRLHIVHCTVSNVKGDKTSRTNDKRIIKRRIQRGPSWIKSDFHSQSTQRQQEVPYTEERNQQAQSYVFVVRPNCPTATEHGRTDEMLSAIGLFQLLFSWCVMCHHSWVSVAMSHLSVSGDMLSLKEEVYSVISCEELERMNSKFVTNIKFSGEGRRISSWAYTKTFEWKRKLSVCLFGKTFTESQLLFLLFPLMLYWSSQRDLSSTEETKEKGKILSYSLSCNSPRGGGQLLLLLILFYFSILLNPLNSLLWGSRETCSIR